MSWLDFNGKASSGSEDDGEENISCFPFFLFSDKLSASSRETAIVEVTGEGRIFFLRSISDDFRDLLSGSSTRGLSMLDEVVVVVVVLVDVRDAEGAIMEVELG